MKVRSIEYAGKRDVYNMEVDGVHSYVVNRGIVAHNCFDETRYMLMARPAPARTPPTIKIEVFDPLKSRRRGV